MTLRDWMAANTNTSTWWFVKRLSGNDTRANRAHQDGPYVAKHIVMELFPSLADAKTVNPDATFELRIDPEGVTTQARAVWYNKRRFGTGTRDEARVTRVGGGASPLLDPESTGAIAIFAFHMHGTADADGCRVWVTRTLEEEGLVEERLGPVEPKTILWDSSVHIGLGPDLVRKSPRSSCRLSAAELPERWLTTFPTGREIIAHTIAICPDRPAELGRRLLQRRDCEYELFQSIEKAVGFQTATDGFESMESFLAHAQSVLQRRKTRSGKSLELHLEAILTEEGLVGGRDFDYQPRIEGGKTPDFLFPGTAAYESSAFPTDRLRMLGVKTSCRDRWRQVLNEADRIPRKHLFTLQEGVSETQFREMEAAGITLVVPESNVSSFAEKLRQKLTGLGDFVREVKALVNPG